MNKHGFVSILAASPEVAVGNPQQNAENIIAMLRMFKGHDIIAFPELCVTGYTCGDLFRQTTLLNGAMDAIALIRDYSKQEAKHQLILVGAPIAVGTELFNCAVVIQDGTVLGVVPKQNIPNYNEFYESRWFRPGNGDEPKMIPFRQGTYVPFGIDLIFETANGVRVFAEICEDLWMPVPPSSKAALAGANILINLSASNETVAKNEYRTQLVANQSGRCVAAYVYASAGPSESTTDLVFGGHCIIAENGTILRESQRVGDDETWVGLQARFIGTEVDVQKLDSERRVLTSFGDSQKGSAEYRRIPWWPNVTAEDKIGRWYNGRPFVPANTGKLKERCTEVFGIQVAGLARRLRSLPGDMGKTVHIGVSGGLDSTLALLVTLKAFQLLKYPFGGIHGYTMPGFGTTAKTKNNALELMRLTGITAHTVDIRAMCLQAFKDIRHDPFDIGMFHGSVDTDKFDVACLEDALSHIDAKDPRLLKGDLVFENVQARMRTFVLMSNGFVIGTGDMSELALGWCTYNGDHMSMYNPNCSIPKTLVKFLVEFVANHHAEEMLPSQGDSLAATLMDIANTTISPELLPAGKDGEITQSTEDVLGPYELHDFFLFHFVRNGFSPEKILLLARHAHFTKKYEFELVKKTLATFVRRFFGQQFKRSCVPDGPKVGSVSLSPRGDWRMPSDADATAWLAQLGG